MYNMEDILARLQDGEDPAAIADEFTTALNGAINQKKIVDEELQAKDEINTYLVAASDALYDYIKLAHPEADEDLIAEMVAEDNLADFIAIMVNAVSALAPLAELFGECKCDCDCKKVEEPKKITLNPKLPTTLSGKITSDDNEIASFLKKFGL